MDSLTEHLSEARLQQLASNTELQPSKAEDEHMTDCEQCLKRFIALVKDTRP